MNRENKYHDKWILAHNALLECVKQNPIVGVIRDRYFEQASRVDAGLVPLEDVDPDVSAYGEVAASPTLHAHRVDEV